MRKYFLLLSMAFAISACSQKMTDHEMHEITRQIAKCWKLPQQPVKQQIATIQVMYDVNGNLQSAELIASDQERAKNNEAFKLFSDNILQAVKHCSPLQGLPRHKHKVWSNIIMTFDSITLIQ